MNKHTIHNALLITLLLTTQCAHPAAAAGAGAGKGIIATALQSVKSMAKTLGSTRLGRFVTQRPAVTLAGTCAVLAAGKTVYNFAQKVHATHAALYGDGTKQNPGLIAKQQDLEHLAGDLWNHQVDLSDLLKCKCTTDVNGTSHISGSDVLSRFNQQLAALNNPALYAQTLAADEKFMAAMITSVYTHLSGDMLSTLDKSLTEKEEQHAQRTTTLATRLKDTMKRHQTSIVASMQQHSQKTLQGIIEAGSAAMQKQQDNKLASLQSKVTELTAQLAALQKIISDLQAFNSNHVHRVIEDAVAKALANGAQAAQPATAQDAAHDTALAADNSALATANSNTSAKHATPLPAYGSTT